MENETEMKIDDNQEDIWLGSYEDLINDLDDDMLLDENNIKLAEAYLSDEEEEEDLDLDNDDFEEQELDFEERPGIREYDLEEVDEVEESKEPEKKHLVESRQCRGRILHESRRPIQRVEWSDFNRFHNDEKYLPNRGEGETMASQLAVAEVKIIYRYFNDGETISHAIGTQSGNMRSYADWIEENIPELSELMAKFPKNRGPKYELFLYKLAEETDRIIDSYADKPKVGTVYPSSGRRHFFGYDRIS